MKLKNKRGVGGREIEGEANDRGREIYSFNIKKK